jgi:hypothetical protein
MPNHEFYCSVEECSQYLDEGYCMIASQFVHAMKTFPENDLSAAGNHFRAYVEEFQCPRMKMLKEYISEYQPKSPDS